MPPSTLKAALLTLAVVASAGCMCSRDSKYRVSSPSHSRSATVAVENCGATTGFTTVVSVAQRRFGLIPSSRDLLIGDGELVGERDLSLRWSSDDELVITINSTATVQRLEKPFTGLLVRYEGHPKFGS
jgi:hypothetical protein